MKRGFGLIELLVVIAILMILGGTGMAVSGMFLNRRSGQEAVMNLRQALREAQLRSMAGERGLRWGVKTENGRIVVFGGDSFANRQTDLDESLAVGRQVNISEKEVVFSRWSGRSSGGTVSFTISWSGGQKTMTVNQMGGIE